MKKMSKIIFLLVVISLINSNFVIGANFLYDVKNKKMESSIATVAGPSFTFESHAQVLMEPTTGQILYANNEEEKMLPASVTKVMTY